MLRIGLTGGIGAGKSTVEALFAARGVAAVDADALARELVEPGQPALAAIVEAFGEEVLDGEGRLDRARMRERVFADPAGRRRLETILHPRVRARMAARAAQLTDPYCILSIPLLVESGQRDLVHRVLVVDVPEPLQIQRVCRRSGLTEAQARAIVAAQASRAERLAAADDIIVNDAGLDRLEAQVERLHRRYLALAARPVPDLPAG
jgi:dephospho-CoA kinase